ncbi:hypothetical protein TruAng_005986 [Truncatella angustata]|nr:hypothetical protein TruAng_005986 [Truncatella angustata]
MPRSQRTFNLPTLTLASQDAASHHSTSQTVPMPPSSLGQMIEERTPEPENGDSYPAPGMDHGRSKKRKTATELGLEVTRERKLACPYYKKDPTKHSTINACCGPGWDSISRLKEAKRADIFRLLFPYDDIIPLPYYEHEQNQFPDANQEPNLQGYRDYICGELSPLLRDELKSEIADELDIFEERVRERAVEVFYKLAPKVLDRYCSSRSKQHEHSNISDGKVLSSSDDRMCSNSLNRVPLPADEHCFDNDATDFQSPFDGFHVPMTFHIGDPYHRSVFVWDPSCEGRDHASNAQYDHTVI